VGQHGGTALPGATGEADRDGGDERGSASGAGDTRRDGGRVESVRVEESAQAIEYYKQQLDITREIGDRQGEGNAFSGLGVAYYSLGEYRRAIDYHDQRLAITREIGDREGEGNAHWNMSLALDELGQRKDAIAHAEVALTIYEQIEHPSTEKVRAQLESWRRES
jgi:tetratricopeptide (TPR) repeat protein